jgi:tetratricopeptide (TPR) repeat protein
MVDGVFVSCGDGLAKFETLLGTLPAGRRARLDGRWHGPGPVAISKSYVLLVHGLGGSGKSRLLQHFRELADGSRPDFSIPSGRVRTVWLDWEDERQEQLGSYASAEGPNLVIVLNALQHAVIASCGEGSRAADRAIRAFGPYRRGVEQTPEYARRFAYVVTQSQLNGSPFTSEDAAVLGKSAAGALLTLLGLPGGAMALSPDQLVASAQAGGRLSAAATRYVTGKKPDEISREDYDLVTDMNRELTRRAAAALRAVAESEPLLILLDTGEVIGERAWAWMRHVMVQTGPRIVWVVGARFGTEAEPGKLSPVDLFVQSIGDERLLRTTPVPFDDSMIRGYLESRTKGRSYTDANIDLIARFTRGLPLAVSIVAQLLEGGLPLEEVCREVDNGLPGSVVSELARRYLVHAEYQQQTGPGNPGSDDVTKILGLALAYGNLRNDPDLLSALWNVQDPLPHFQELASRHDFILPRSRRLHEDVRDTLRTDLLDPYRRSRSDVRDINQRALEFFTRRLEKKRGSLPSLDEQLDSSEFTTAVLSVLWHTLWIHNRTGLELFAQLAPVLFVADPVTFGAAMEIVEQFAGTFSEDERSKLNFGAEIAPDSVPLLGNRGDRTAALMIAEARSHAADHNDERAMSTLFMAAARTASSRLQQVIDAGIDAIINRRLWVGSRNTSMQSDLLLTFRKMAIGMITGTLNDLPDDSQSIGDPLAACDQAVAAQPDDVAPHMLRVIVLWSLRRFGDALEAVDRALTLAPADVDAHMFRGLLLSFLGRTGEAAEALDQAFALAPDDPDAYPIQALALSSVGRFDEALAICDRALALDPDHVAGHSLVRMLALYFLGRFGEALAICDEALALDPDHAIVHVARGTVLHGLGHLTDALEAYDRAIALDPDNDSAHGNKGIALAALGDLDDALSELEAAERLASDDMNGEISIWIGAILWHKRDAARARERFASVEGRAAGSSPFHIAEIEALALCGLNQAERAEQRLLETLPLRAPGDEAESRGLYDLLSDPPLPGIDRLRALKDTGT